MKHEQKRLLSFWMTEFMFRDGLRQGWAIYGLRAGSGPPQCFIRPTSAYRNHDYNLYGYKFPLKISMKINESSDKINIAIFYVLSAPEYYVQNEPHIP